MPGAAGHVDDVAGGRLPPFELAFSLREHLDTSRENILQWAVIDPHVEPDGIAHGPEGKGVVEVHAVARDVDGNAFRARWSVTCFAFDAELVKRFDIRASSGRNHGGVDELEALSASGDHLDLRPFFRVSISRSTWRRT